MVIIVEMSGLAYFKEQLKSNYAIYVTAILLVFNMTSMKLQLIIADLEPSHFKY